MTHSDIFLLKQKYVPTTAAQPVLYHYNYNFNGLCLPGNVEYPDHPHSSEASGAWVGQRHQLPNRDDDYNYQRLVAAIY